MKARFIAGALAALAAAAAAAQQVAPPAAGSAPGTAAAAQPSPNAAAPAGSSPPARPLTPSDEAERRKLEEQIAKELGAPAPGSAAQPPAAGPGTGAALAPQAAPGQGTTGGNPYARLLLLPDISAIGDFALAYDGYDVPQSSPRPDLYGRPNTPTPLFQELELALQSVVDPYARADVFISFHPDGVDVEEAYLTTLSLPAGLQVRAGKFFSPFGRLEQQHPHVWDFVDAPLAATRVVAGDVLSGPGVDVAWLAPLPWFAELHLAGQDTAPATPLDPGASAAGDRLTGIARLVQFFPAGEATTVGVGLSAAVRGEGAGGLRDLGGVDLYARIRPPETRAYLALQGELYGRRFTGMPGGSAWGTYAQAFWRQSPYWGYGVRYDRAPAAGDSAPGTEQRASAVASWFLSEFQRVRLQATWDRRPGGKDALEALLHLEFGIGAHGAHPF